LSDEYKFSGSAASHVNPFRMHPRKTLEPGAQAAPARRRGGLVGEVVDSLGGHIRDGRLRAGDKLPTETEIMASHAVSRTVVREAMSRLQAAGLVQTRHGIGTFVLPPPDAGNFRIGSASFATVADVISVLELRISLETEAAGLAAQRRSSENLDAMESELNAFHDSIRSQSDAVPSDLRFHLEVARATGNRHFADLMSYLGTMVIPRMRINSAGSAPEGRLAYLQRINSEHESIYIAIRNQDAEAARAAMRMHLSNSRERLRRGGVADPAHRSQSPEPAPCNPASGVAEAPAPASVMEVKLSDNR
jgi:DNA-binding FadR family transcriptional regulator